MHAVAKDLCNSAKLVHNEGEFPYGGAQGALDRVGAPHTAPLREKGIHGIVHPQQLQNQNQVLHPNTKLVTKMTAADKVIQQSLLQLKKLGNLITT